MWVSSRIPILTWLRGNGRFIALMRGVITFCSRWACCPSTGRELVAGVRLEVEVCGGEAEPELPTRSAHPVTVAESTSAAPRAPACRVNLPGALTRAAPAGDHHSSRRSPRAARRHRQRSRCTDRCDAGGPTCTAGYGPWTCVLRC